MRKKILTGVIAFSIMFVLTTLFVYYFRHTEVVGPSMTPTLEEGQRVMFLYTHDVDRGDIAIIRDDAKGIYLIKRVIGVGGDTVEVKNGVLYVNNETLVEPYLLSQDWDAVDFSIVVPEGMIFVMGDNRDDSYDSRQAGPFSLENVYGRYLFKI